VINDYPHILDKLLKYTVNENDMEMKKEYM